ncbi:MAG: histidinol-phosphate transaminase [Ilumatobacteraceae bacterium]
MERVSERRDTTTTLPAAYHSPQLDVAVRLNTNEAPSGPPPVWLDELVDGVRRLEWNRYPDRDATALRTAIAAHHGVDLANVFAANGSNEVLQSILMAFGGRGRTAATFEPSYLLHRHIAEITGTSVVSGERNDHFDLAPAVVADVLGSHRPDVTFLCSPNNPTGNVMSRDVLATALDLVSGETAASGAAGVVVVDEAYAQFASWSSLDLVGEHRPLAVVRTFSKTWGLAGLRLGYAVAPRQIVAQLERVALPYHLDAAKQLAGTLALRHVGAMNDRVAQIVAERERLTSELRTLDIDVFDSEANFVLFRPRSRAGHDVWQALVDRGVLVRDCSSWPRLQGCLRVTVGTVDEDDAFLAAMHEAMIAVPT